MKILQSDLFLKQLNHILDFIELHSINAKNDFRNELLKSLKNLDFMPYKFRKSYSFDNENIRDFIFKGYVIPYFIDEQKNTILIIAIFRENLLNLE